MSTTAPSDVVDFWRSAGPTAWFRKDAAFDDLFRSRFADAHFAAARRELDRWADAPESALALLILLDQFPRNCFRGTGHMFATDPLARHFARLVLERGFDERIEPALRVFCYLPLTHSESLADQDRALELNRQGHTGPEALKAAQEHRDIIARFGRFPHRNDALGRTTSAEEQAFLDGGGFKG